MAKKNECYLCGGKLHDGYCPDCGLDNTKIRKRHYHLNESYAVESMNGDENLSSEKCDFKAGQDSQEKGSAETEKRDSPEKKKDRAKQVNIQPVKTYSYQFRNTGRNPGPKASWSKMAVIFAVVAAGIVVGIGIIGNYIFKQDINFGGLIESRTEVVNVGPYEYVERELSETGEHYETELGQGEYLVGVHLPEGRYTAELLEGRGGLSLEDMENGIYIWQSFGTDAEYDEIQILEDVRLYTGAHVTIKDPVLLKLTTENGQTDDLDKTENPLTESVKLEKDESLEVGEEIVPGVYDLHAESGWSVLRCRILDDAYEDGYYEISYWLSGEEMDDIYKNIYLKEDTVVTAEESTLELTPSPMIGTGDYGEYYQYY